MTTSCFDARQILLSAALCGLLWIGEYPDHALAVQRMDVVDESSISVTVSSRDVNVITAPSPILHAYTSKPEIEVKTQGRHVIVTTGATAGELVLLTEQQVYVLQLKPQNGPSETIILNDRRVADTTNQTDQEQQNSADYIDELTTLMRNVFLGQAPAGMRVIETPKERHLTWVELELVHDRLYRGATYLLRRVEWRNDTAGTQTFREKSFFTGRELAIAFDRLRVEPGQSVTAVMVYPAPGRDAERPASPLPPAEQ
ncbi:MAG: type-F conjugative transfer system secretin TraK [Nitrospirota bacterium]